MFHELLFLFSTMMQDSADIPHLFRTEYSKMVAVLCRTFGLDNIQFAEDVVSDTFLKAAETWGLKGMPEHPKAWLYQVAKNKAKDEFKRKKIYQEKVEIAIQDQQESSTHLHIDLSDANIEDSVLQMLFTVCDPVVSKEAQITFALRTLCGFGIEEIASGLLTTKSVINKRLYRTKEAFRKAKVDVQFPPEEALMERLDNVLSVLYLIFNEGYYSATSEKTIQKDLCIEAMRLLFLVLKYPPANLPKVNALMALFCFHASRFEARVAEDGTSILYEDQDQNKWDKELIEQGELFIRRATTDQRFSKYQIEAWIAFWHSRIQTNEHEKWNNILQLYNQLIQIEYSPVTALNRTYALAKVKGNDVALKEALKIDLAQHHLYHMLLAELYKGINDQKISEHLELALTLADTENDKQLIMNKLSEIKK